MLFTAIKYINEKFWCCFHTQFCRLVTFIKQFFVFLHFTKPSNNINIYDRKFILIWLKKTHTHTQNSRYNFMLKLKSNFLISLITYKFIGYSLLQYAEHNRWNIFVRKNFYTFTYLQSIYALIFSFLSVCVCVYFIFSLFRSLSFAFER